MGGVGTSLKASLSVFALSSVLTGCLAPPAFASAWNPKAWDGEIISGYVQSKGDEAVDRFGEVVELDVYTKRNVQNFTTLGITDRIALIGQLDYQSAQIIGPGVDTTFKSLTTVRFGAQYQLQRTEGRAIAVSVSYYDGVDLPNALLTVESREPAVELRALWGEDFQLAGKPVFAEAQLAGRVKTSGGYASTHAQATLGLHASHKIMAIGKLRLTDIEPGVFTNLLIERQRRVESEASLIYRIRPRRYLEFGYVGTVSARNAVREHGVKIGTWVKF